MADATMRRPDMLLDTQIPVMDAAAGRTDRRFTTPRADAPTGIAGDDAPRAQARPRCDVLRAAAAAAALSRENERLHAQLEAQMEEVRASRARLVAAGDAERRRLERDLHDGAQSRFVAIALQLRHAHTKAPPGSELAKILDTAIGELATGLDELRELARGIHPAVLSERGVDAALDALAARAPLPVDVRGAVRGRLATEVEVAAYFAASEALQNVAKYADATRATVEVRHDGRRLLVEVSDDGRGGACPEAGSGLRGLADRVGALDGRLEVHSPRGAGTRVRVEIPCVGPRAAG